MIKNIQSTSALKSLAVTVSAMAFLISIGCTTTVSQNINDAGQVATSDLVFPEPQNAWQKDGQFPNSENLSKIRAGISKDNLYQLIGPPHFNEAQNAREWDYIFKFDQADGSLKTCQFKVIFNKDYRGQQFYWQPADCAVFADFNTPATPDQSGD